MINRCKLQALLIDHLILLSFSPELFFKVSVVSTIRQSPNQTTIPPQVFIIALDDGFYIVTSLTLLGAMHNLVHAMNFLITGALTVRIMMRTATRMDPFAVTA